MFLSNRDLKQAIESGELICEPTPQDYGDSSIDLHLDKVDEAKIWSLEKFKEANGASGHGTTLRIGEFDYGKFSINFTTLVPEIATVDENTKVFRNGNEVYIKPNGFLLWQTKEKVGSAKGSKLICFIEGKSTKARTGIVVHLTAPTIHCEWSGQITLEIVNLGPFVLVLKEDDAIAQITVAKVTSNPDELLKIAKSQTIGQTSVTGREK
jgi:dCTP deaminase